MGILAKIFLILLIALPAAAQSRRNLIAPLLVTSSTPPSSLVTNLSAYWRLDETSGTRSDAHGTNVLNDQNTVGYTTGLFTNAAITVSNATEYLYAIDSPELSIEGSSFTLAGWVTLHTTNITQKLAGKYTSTGAGREWFFEIGNNQRFMFYVYTNNTSSSAYRTVGGTTRLWTNNWIFFAAVHEYNANKMTLFTGSQSQSLGEWITNDIAILSQVTNGTGQFTLGAVNGLNSYSDARFDEVGFWKRNLTTNEILTLYNNGSGRTYPFQ